MCFQVLLSYLSCCFSDDDNGLGGDDSGTGDYGGGDTGTQQYDGGMSQQQYGGVPQQQYGGGTSGTYNWGALQDVASMNAT